MLTGIRRHRQRGCSATGTDAVAERVHAIAMTDARTRRGHLVTDDAAAAGRADGGRYVACCGVVVLAASLTTPESSSCGSCAGWCSHGESR